MAHPLPIGTSVSAGPGMILMRPELAALIGSICSGWAFVESSLGMFYGHLMGVYLEISPGYEPPSHPVAHQIFDEIHTIQSRIQLVEKLADWVKDEPQKIDILKVLKKLKRAAQCRNKVAHGVWGVCESEPKALILLQTFGHKLIYKKADFDLILEQIKTANRDLGLVHHAFYQGRKKKLSQQNNELSLNDAEADSLAISCWTSFLSN